MIVLSLQVVGVQGLFVIGCTIFLSLSHPSLGIMIANLFRLDYNPSPKSSFAIVLFHYLVLIGQSLLVCKV